MIPVDDGKRVEMNEEDLQLLLQYVPAAATTRSAKASTSTRLMGDGFFLDGPACHCFVTQ